MSIVTLAQAEQIIDAIFKRGEELNLRPLSVIVVEPGCKVKAFKKEDGSSMIRFEMAFGKAYAALAMGRSSSLVRVRAGEKPIFMRYLLSATEDQIVPETSGGPKKYRRGGPRWAPPTRARQGAQACPDGWWPTRCPPPPPLRPIISQIFQKTLW
jgi:uncharacterized protein GlcG (DUF336 family)